METEFEEVNVCIPQEVVPRFCSGECKTEQNSMKERKTTPGIGTMKSHNSEMTNKNFIENSCKNSEAISYTLS